VTPAITVFAAVYWTVLVAELIGDKTIYTVTSLALRFPRRIVLAAIVLACAVKMACAVLIGGLLLRLPPHLIAWISAAGFLIAAATVTFEDEEKEKRSDGRWGRGALACFVPLFITEWADPGQIVTVAASARTAMPGVVWLAGTLAMTTKGTFALLFGVTLRNHMPRRVTRAVAVVSLTLLGVFALVSDVYGH